MIASALRFASFTIMCTMAHAFVVVAPSSTTMTQNQQQSLVTMYAYVPDGLTAEQWKKIKANPSDSTLWSLYIGKKWTAMTVDDKEVIASWQQELYIQSIAEKEAVYGAREKEEDLFKEPTKGANTEFNASTCNTLCSNYVIDVDPVRGSFNIMDCQIVLS